VTQAGVGSGIDEFLEDSRSLVGRQPSDVPQGSNVADFPAIVRFASAIANRRPLYTDPAYGVTSRYHTIIAPPTFVMSIRTPNSGAAFNGKSYGLIKMAKSASFAWNDVIRIGDRLVSDIQLTGVSEGVPLAGRRTARVESAVTYHNSYGGLIGRGSGSVRVIPFTAGEALLSERDIYQYTDAEVEGIKRDIDNEAPPLGQRLRYWNDVTVGEALPGLCKPHLSIDEFQAWLTAEAKPLPRATLTYFILKDEPGRARSNPTTHWPLMEMEEMFNDINCCQAVGFKIPVCASLHPVALAGQLATDWMGDDGFLRRLSVELTDNFYHYSDSLWLSGEVTGKQEEQVGGETYFAVDLRLAGVNQLRQPILDGTATVYLPNPGRPVELPIRG
jgi:hypothetical protein